MIYLVTGNSSLFNSEDAEYTIISIEESLKLYHRDRYIETGGEYNPELLKSDYNGTYYNGELLNISIYDIY